MIAALQLFEDFCFFGMDLFWGGINVSHRLSGTAQSQMCKQRVEPERLGWIPSFLPFLFPSPAFQEKSRGGLAQCQYCARLKDRILGRYISYLWKDKVLKHRTVTIKCFATFACNRYSKKKKWVHSNRIPQTKYVIQNELVYARNALLISMI